MAGARLARNEGRQRTRPSLASTLPADLARPSRAWQPDRPSWCVDMGPTLVAMSTCDLWLSLARNDVTRRTKVWREGMPYWEALEMVPEFALAMPEADAWDDRQARLPPAPAAETFTMASIASAPASKIAGETRLSATSAAALPPPRELSATGVITLIPPSDFATPAPVVVERRSISGAATANKRRIFPRLDRRGAISIAFGAAIAFGALMVATTGPVRPRPASNDVPAVQAAAAARGPAPGVELTSILPATSSAAASRPAPPPRGPHAADRGQRRVR